MSFNGRSFDPTRIPDAPRSPFVDYSMARRALLASLRRGEVTTSDVCDAHPELLRAGKNIGREMPSPCPVCSHDSLRGVRYVYGEELKRNNGRVVYPEGWLFELQQEHEHFTCYVVEVCIDCSWNHLLRSYQTGRRYESSRRDSGYVERR